MSGQPRASSQGLEGYATVTHGTHLVALVRAGAEFENSKLVERPAES
jgi:hypothetical protein